jgi:hypothetical protein
MKSALCSLTFLLFVATADVYSQAQQLLINQLKLPQIAPASPDAAAIEKFGNFPVNYSTGVPGVNIPLWTVQCGTLSWPVSLSYHASGIKVDESASMAGLGWSIDVLGVITRSVNGRPDEETTLGEPTNYTSVTSNDWDYLYKVNDNLADGELDLFNFSFNGRSGKFVIKHEDGTILQVPQSNLKITHDAALHVFTIKDETGAVYTFDKEERSTTISGSPTSTTYTTSWYLTKIELPDKNNTVRFVYSYAGQTSDFYMSYTQTIGRKYQQNISGGQPNLVTISPNIQPSSSSVNIDLMRLDSIYFPNGSVVFNYDPNARQDIGSNNVYNELNAIVINEVNGGLMAPVKTFRFNQSYFHYLPTGYTDKPGCYRLRLDNLVESGSLAGPDLKKYIFQYNTSVNLSPRSSTGQDMWGFNNGITGNNSLLQQENITFYDGQQTMTGSVGDANRSVVAAQMEAWMLTSITYPTGGKTTFDYEPHLYTTDATTATSAGTSISVMGNQAPPLDNTSGTVTFPTAGVVPGTPRVTINMSECSFPGVTQLSAVYLTDVTLSQDIYVLSHPRPAEKYSIDFPINLVAGHQYKVRATLSTNPAVISAADAMKLSASIALIWSESTDIPDIRTGGGLRIKEMIHYTDNSTIASKETFVYDTAVTMTPFNLISQRYKEVNYQLGIPSGFGCATWMGPVCRVYHSQSVFAVSNVLGSPMLYRRVEKINVNPTTGAPNGKSVYLYDVFQDKTIPIGGPLALGAQWSNGFLKSETHYRYDGSAYLMIQNKENEYNIYNSSFTYGFRVEPRYIVDGCFNQHTSATVTNDLRYYTVHLPTGSKRLAKQTVTEIDELQHSLVTTTVNFYGSLDYDYPTAVVTVDSKNSRDSVTYKRPPDFAVTGNVYDKMELQNILQPLIEEVSYTNGTKLSTLKNNYRDWFSNSKVLALDTVQASLYTNPLETRVRYLAYDAYGNPLSMSRDKDIVTSYLWAYNSARPIAQVVNGGNTAIAYTSFETSETGGWSGISAVGTTLSGSLTGMRAWTQTNFNISKSGLSNSTSYVVSFWSKGVAFQVNGVAATAGRSVNGWTFYSRKVTPTTGSISVTGSGTIDELRLYPATGQMTSYTYEPLAGVSTAADPNNRIVFYEYDELQRPILIRDQERNIVKKFSYNYFGVTEYPSIFYNTAQTVQKYKQGCTSCQIGSLVSYTVPANTYLSTESQTTANNLASAEANANAQAYANSVGTCTAPVSSVMTGNNSISNAFTVKFHNNCTGTDYTYTLNPTTTITFSPAIPTGNYTVTITKKFAPSPLGTAYTYKVNGQLLSTTSDPTFFNVTVLATGNQGVITQL